MSQTLKRIGLWTATAVAYALLIDVATETFLCGSSLRWVVLAVVVAYVLGSVALWRLLALGTKFELALVTFAALIAFSGWSLGSLMSSGGVCAAGRSAGALGALVVAGVLVVGLGWVSLNTRLNPATRAVIAVIFLYALIPLGASVAGTGLGAALNGSVASLPGPYWTRGAFVGVYILLPLIAVGGLVVAIASIRKSPREAGAAVRAAVAAVVALQLGTLEAGTQGLPSPVALERVTLMPTPPAPIGEPSAAPTAVSNGSPLPTQAVASPTAGVLASSAPSTSAVAAGGDSNLGVGTRHNIEDVVAALDTPGPAQASDSSVPDAPHLRLAARSIPRELYDVKALADQLPADPNAIDAFVRDHVALEVYPGAMRGAAATWMGRSGNVVDRALLLAALLRAKGFRPQFAAATLSDDELRRLHDQLSTAPQDYDPQGAGASPQPVEVASADNVRHRAATLVYDGSRRADGIVAALAAGGTSLTNDSTPGMDELRHHVWVRVARQGQMVDLDSSLSGLQPGQHLGVSAEGARDDLPDPLYGTIALRLVAQSGSDAANKEYDLASLRLRTADLGMQPLRLAITPVGDEADLARVAAATRFVAAIGVGSNLQPSAPFSVKDPIRGSLRSVRLEIVTTQPDRPARKYDRWLLTEGDRNDPNLGARIVGLRTLLVQDAPLNMPFVVATMLDAAAQLSENLAHPASRENQLLFPTDVLTFFTWDAASSASLASRYGVTFRYDRPRIAMESSGFALRSGTAVGLLSFDIVENAAAAYGDRGAYANVALGAIDTQLEHDVLGVDSVGALDALDAGKEAMRVLRAAPSDQGQYLGLRQSFDRGDIAVALNAPVAVRGKSTWSWWDVDPHGGATVGRSTGGAGDDLAEMAAILSSIKALVSALQMISACKHGSSGKCVCAAITTVVDVIGMGLAFAVAAGAAVKGLALGVNGAGIIGKGACL